MARSLLLLLALFAGCLPVQSRISLPVRPDKRPSFSRSPSLPIKNPARPESSDHHHPPHLSELPESRQRPRFALPSPCASAPSPALTRRIPPPG
eukprot:799112-Rhodomonas_salina.2